MIMKEKIQLLKDYFSKKPEILMAFVFGSYAKNQETLESDFDLAIYFKPEGKSIEWEETKYYQNEDDIWTAVEKIVQIPTDLIILNRAPSTLAFSVVQECIPVIIKDRSLYLRFFLMISSAAEYFREWTRDFWEIKNRSLLLTDINKDRLIRIVDFLESELIDYSQFIDIDQKTYESDASMRRNVERWVENIVNASLDIAKILLASQKKRIPQTYRQVMEELSLLENFKLETAKTLSQFAKFRNIVAHEYFDSRFDQINKFIQQAESPYKELVRFVKNHIKEE